MSRGWDVLIVGGSSSLGPSMVSRLVEAEVRTIGVRVAGIFLGILVTSLTARVLQPERFGLYTFIVAIMTIAAIPPNIGLRQTIAREASYAAADDDVECRGGAKTNLPLNTGTLFSFFSRALPLHIRFNTFKT